MVMPFMAFLLRFVAAAMPFINPLTPRLNSDVLAFMGLGLFGWVTHTRLDKAHQVFRVNALGMLCASWVVLACVQFYLQMETRYFSFFLISIFYLLAVILLGAWGSMWVQAQKAAALADAFMVAVWLGGMSAALGIGLQMFGLESWISPWLQQSHSLPRQSGFLGQPNLSASLMCSAMACLVFMCPHTPDKAAKPSVWRCVSLAVMMLAMHGASSRTGYVEVVAMTVVLFVFRQRFEIDRVWLAMPVWLLLALGLGELMVAQGWVHAASAVESTDLLMRSSAERLLIWGDILRMIQSSPWLGVGWHQLQVSEVLKPGVQMPVGHAHNLFLHIQVELGVLGTAGLLAFGVCVWKVVASWRSLSSYQVVMLTLVLLLGMHSMLEYPLWHALFLFLFGFAFALLPVSVRTLGVPPRWSHFAAIGTMALSFWVYVDHTVALRAYEAFGQHQNKGRFIADNDKVFWNRLLLETTFMVETPVNADTLPVMRKIAMTNANVYSQKHFANLPLLKVMILDGEKAIANQLAWRMCRNFPPDLWPSIAQHLNEQPDPRYRHWVQQLPDLGNCKEQ